MQGKEENPSSSQLLEKRKPSSVLDSKSILSDAVKESKLVNSIEKIEELGSSADLDSAVSAIIPEIVDDDYLAKQKNDKSKKETERYFTLFIVGCVVVFCFVFWLKYIKSDSDSQVSEMESTITVEEPVRSADDSLSVVKTDPDKTQQSLALQSVIDKIAQIGVKKEPSSSETSDDEIDKEALAIAEQSNLKDSEVSQKTSQTELVSLGDSSNGDSQQQVNSERIPELNPGILNNNKIESLGEVGENTLYREVTRGEDGQLYGSRPPEGIKGYPVIKYDPPVFYRTVKSTEVLSQPSMVAKSRDKIRSGTRVKVVGSMGHWLEIRSSKGRRGFILSQDASIDSNQN